MADSYDLVPHATLGNLPAKVCALTRLAFGTYPGVLVPTEADMAWYIRRPGMDAYLSRAALWGEQLAASLFVTVAPVKLGGRLQLVGIVDTVMTHPDHRCRGLARRLLIEAIGLMRERGLAASLLYTLPGSVGYELYRSLGYRPHVPVHYLRRRQPSMAAPDLTIGSASPAPAASSSGLIAFLNRRLAGADGYIPLDGPLWCWRRQMRPESLPAQTVVVTEGRRLLGCGTLCHAPIVGSAAPAWVLADLALAPGSSARAWLECILAVAHPGDDVIALCAESDRKNLALLQSIGFAPSGCEVAMVLPLAPEVRDTLATTERPWYVLVESVIGV